MRIAALLLLAAGCVTTAPKPDRGPEPPLYPEAAPRPPGPAVALKGATVLTAAGQRIENGVVVLKDGRIAAVGGPETAVPEGVPVVDVSGKFVTPGIIDTHSHLGVYPAPESSGNSDGNEMVDPVTAQVWAEHAFWPQDPQIPRALAGGITSMQVLPGSGNLIGGRGFTVKLRPALSAREMHFPGAKPALKMACGENPKRVYGSSQRAPMTRMGNVAGYRAAFQAAREYKRKWDLWLEKKEGEPPPRDLKMETLAEVLRGNILVHNHCYRADEMLVMLQVAEEFGFQIRSFHHAVEAYKIAKVLADKGVASSIWAGWWGFKMESFDGIPENAALLQRAGARAIIHSDSAIGIQRLNQEAARAMAAGRAAGIEVTDDQALRWITANPAWALGVDDKTGTLEAGKMADVVVWSSDPLSVYARAEKVFIDGELVYDAGQGMRKTDFELGVTP